MSIHGVDRSDAIIDPGKLTSLEIRGDIRSSNEACYHEIYQIQEKADSEKKFAN